MNFNIDILTVVLLYAGRLTLLSVASDMLFLIMIYGANPCCPSAPQVRVVCVCLCRGGGR